MGDVVIDTDVASVVQKGRSPGWVNRHLAGQRVWLTFVSPMTTVSKTWARLAARAQQRGRPRPQNDTWIAACCVRHDLPLVTLNTKDFEDFARHDGLILLGE